MEESVRDNADKYEGKYAISTNNPSKYTAIITFTDYSKLQSLRWRVSFVNDSDNYFSMSPTSGKGNGIVTITMTDRSKDYRSFDVFVIVETPKETKEMTFHLHIGSQKLY